MPAIVTALTEGNIITITSTETNYGITTTTKVVRTKKQCYVNITGPGTGLTYSIIDHKGAIIFSKEFVSNGTQAEVTHSINGAITLANITTQFNTWNGGAGVTALQPERVYIAQLTQSSTSAPTYTVIKNTLGSPIVFAYGSTGVYTQAIGTIYDKTKAAYACGGGTAATTTIQLGVNADNLTLTTATSQAVANGVLSATPVSIRVQH
jgi:hypothetical protein